MSGEPQTESGRDAVAAIKSGSMTMWADDPADPIGAMVRAVEAEAIAQERERLAAAGRDVVAFAEALDREAGHHDLRLVEVSRAMFRDALLEPLRTLLQGSSPDTPTEPTDD